MKNTLKWKSSASAPLDLSCSSWAQGKIKFARKAVGFRRKHTYMTLISTAGTHSLLDMFYNEDMAPIARNDNVAIIQIF